MDTLTCMSQICLNHTYLNVVLQAGNNVGLLVGKSPYLCPAYSCQFQVNLIVLLYSLLLYIHQPSQVRKHLDHFTAHLDQFRKHLVLTEDTKLLEAFRQKASKFVLKKLRDELCIISPYCGVRTNKAKVTKIYRPLRALE